MSANTTKKSPDTKKDADPHAKPEAMVLGIGAWVVAVVLEGVQQLLNLGASFFNMGRLRSQVVEMGKEQGQELTDSMVTVLSVSALLISLLLSLLVLGAIGYFIYKVSTRGKNADSLQKMLSFFAGYLMFKALMVTFTPPAGGLPAAYYAVSGSLQIIVGVAAVVGAVLINRKESVDWVVGEKKDHNHKNGGANQGNSSTSHNSAEEGKTSSESLISSLLGKGKKKDELTESATTEDDEGSTEEAARK